MRRDRRRHAIVVAHRSRDAHMPVDTSAIADAQELYRGGSGVRPSALGEEGARAYLRDFVDFVNAAAPGRGRLLDVGCGSGWSSRILAEKSFDVCGTDLTTSAVEVPSSDRLKFVAADAMALPFASESFDVVCAYQMLEHVPDPGRALSEFHRVLRPGGTVCIVGPNLISLLHSVRVLFFHVWRNRPAKSILVRHPGMSKDPFGNTLPEAAKEFAANVARLFAKTVANDATFSMRTPDTVVPFHGDNDACYRCNPLDLAIHFRKRGYRVLHRTKPGRPSWIGPLVGGTWFAARKLSP